MKGILVFLACLVLALPAAAEDAPRLPERFSHVPPAEAEPGAPFVLEARIARAWQATYELRFRFAGEEAWRTETFQRKENDAYRATVPAEVVRPPGFEYFIAGAGPEGRVLMPFASAEDPHRVAVHEQEEAVLRARELLRIRGRRASAHGSYEWVDFGAREINGKTLNDRFYRVDLDFTYRLLRFPLYSLRFGYTQLLGDTPATARGDAECQPAQEDEQGSCTGQAGFRTSGWVELRFRLSSVADIDLRGIVAATKTDFSGGARAVLRFGSELGSHVALGAEGIQETGVSFFLRLGWDTVPHLPMAATIELTDMPSSHRDMALRLLYDVAIPMDNGFRVGARLGYQARDQQIGGATGGLSLAFDF